MLKLDNVTFIIIDCIDLSRAKNTIKFCLKKAKFFEAKLLTHLKTIDEFYEYSIVSIDNINSIQNLSYFCIKKLNNYFDTNFVLLGQYDGYILHEDMWSDEFLEYDYIGAPWPEFLIKEGPKIYNVGNGGFSLRSKKLQTILQEDDNIILDNLEDVAICRLNRPYLENEYGIRFAPYEVAEKFSFEYISYYNQPIKKTFGVHNFMLPPWHNKI